MSKKNKQKRLEEDIEVVTPDDSETENIDQSESMEVFESNDVAESKEVVESKKGKDKNADKNNVQDSKNKKDKSSKKKKKEKGPNKFVTKTKETISELKKVSWPSFKAVCKNTGVVIAVVVVCTLILFGIDRLLAFLYSLIPG